MNKEALQQRLTDLIAQGENQKKIIEKAIADFNAIEGAKQDTLYWLNEVALNKQQNLTTVESGSMPPQNTYNFVIKKSADKNNDLFYVLWVAIWNGHLYADSMIIDPNDYSDFQDFLIEISKALTILKHQMISSYNEIDKTIEKGARTLDELYSSSSYGSGLAISDANTAVLLEKARKEFQLIFDQQQVETPENISLEVDPSPINQSSLTDHLELDPIVK